MQQLLAAGGDVRAVDEGGRTLLHAAALANQPELVRFLVERGLSPSVALESGATPLMLAARRGAVAATRALLDAGAPIDARGLDGMAALHQAAFMGQLATVELLLARGAELDAQDDNGYTALHWAASRHPELVDLLLRRGADPHQTNRRGHTALHLAVMLGDLPSVEALLRRGARDDVPDRAGATPVQMARKPEVFAKLRDAHWALHGKQAPVPLAPMLVVAAVDERRSALAACYEAALQAAPLDVTVYIQVAADGRVEKVWTAPTSDRAVYSCVQRALANLKFPHSSSGGSFPYRLDLRPQDLPAEHDPADSQLSRL